MLPGAVRRRAELLRLPPRVALFFARARRLAVERGDEWSITSATGPRSLGFVLREARGARRVVEIGTGTGWTAIAAALADRDRSVVSYDPVVRPERDWYLDLARPDVRRRIELRTAAGEEGPPAGSPPVEFLFVDGSHERERTKATFEAWRPALAPGAGVAFHDWRNPVYPGVTEAIEELGLQGRSRGDVFVWHAPAPSG